MTEKSGKSSSEIMYDSFSFGGWNSLADWGIRVIAHDFLMPQKRDRRLTIPNRSGSYSYGGRPVYEDRRLVIDCVLEGQISKTQLRQIAYELSGREQIRLWNEPGLYYLGEVMSPPDVTDFPMEAMREFTLEFVCDPFAYSDLVEQNIGSGVQKINYKGTAQTPTVLVLTNNTAAEISNIQITITRRDD